MRNLVGLFLKFSYLAPLQVKTIFQAQALSKLMVVLQTDTYGSAGTDIFATYEELVYAKKEKMHIYAVKMAPKVEEPGVQAMFNTLQGAPWSDKAAVDDKDGQALE
ncbi:hypothetical protein CEUSTIGMA_g12123.t1 [Chlamydomonas eustigma]|uniref:Uncharacterized protein n=1 Tax=Chlamydomonas eustigma TaxID=1157962 RepID=A0A250XNN1_9CHLO|nr:hypothetical protein CEUSTIGMA_g12123.t1 [Chlamydomonas eustigma]|eukprot:GAX84701.1 hypothetical protein CEUSTIGMA_g12123.t1 [Chlamydomonas eustigma]